jgi:hypothetical protein
VPLRQPLAFGLVAAASGISLFAVTAAGQSRACPNAGAVLEVRLPPPAQGTASTVAVLGSLLEASCASDGPLSEEYAETVVCDPQVAESCQATVSDLHPGLWVHRVFVMKGESAGQMQARRGLLLSARGGSHSLNWPLFRSVTTITSLSDQTNCVGCLRAALTLSETAPKPTLVQFSPTLVGSIALSAALPPLAGGNTTVDGFDFNGRPHSREIDANGIDAAALKITSANNTVQGLRIRNVGGNSDTVLIEGTEANRNTLEHLQVFGRAESVCGNDLQGCLIDGTCRNFVCGDDGIAMRAEAGQSGENVVRACEVVGAFDKGIKVSNGALGRVERSHVHHNRDGGMQATLSGAMIAVENLVELNRGTNSANGLAANGPEMGSPVPSRLRTEGNISRWNALRGISIRSLSEATLRQDYICGNGTPERGIGFGILVDDAAGLSAVASAEGLGVVHNLDGGVVVANSSVADLGGAMSRGFNALAFNGPAGATPTNLRNLSTALLSASNNDWQHCGEQLTCNHRAVLMHDVFQPDGAGSVIVAPARRGRERVAIEIDSIAPPFAAAGELVRLYGKGFDAIGGNAPAGGCDTIAEANSCRPTKGNCVAVGGEAADVIAVTPTMLVIRAPFTCIEPTAVTVHNRRMRGVARHDFCRVD